MTVQQLCEMGGFHLLTAGGEREIGGCFSGDLLSHVLANAVAGQAWITIQTHRNVVAVAAQAQLACVLIADGCQMNQETLEEANAHGLAVVRCDLPAFEAALVVGRALGLTVDV